MKTYKQKYLELKKDYEAQGQYRGLYLNTIEELRRLRPVIEAYVENNQEKFIFYMKGYIQHYMKPEK